MEMNDFAGARSGGVVNEKIRSKMSAEGNTKQESVNDTVLGLCS